MALVFLQMSLKGTLLFAVASYWKKYFIAKVDKSFGGKDVCLHVIYCCHGDKEVEHITPTKEMKKTDITISLNER